jgi:hypothetical protein
VICGIVNALWLTACLPDAVRFRRAASHVRDEQQRLLHTLVRVNAATEFGRRYGFSTIRSPRDFQDRVPLLTYEDIRPAVERLAAGESGILSSEPVNLFEPTGGSAGTIKLIPYTAALRREFQRAIRPWIANLFLARPELMEGHAYWAVSPATAPAQWTTGGLPIGFEDDSAYIGGWQRRLVQMTMAVPATLRKESDIERFRYLTLRALIQCSSLRIVSIWHPSFLSWLVERLPEWGDALVREVSGFRRRAALRAALRARTPAERHARLWPRLGLISCWADAASEGPAAAIGRLFPQATLQGKGLIATEGIVSFPLVNREGAILAVRSHFLEFAPEGDRSGTRPALAHELEVGGRYAVIISTGGGLYRYQLQDVVQVVGVAGQCPLIRFVGRGGSVSDWFGEKLTDACVGGVLKDAIDRSGVVATFAMVAYDDGLSPGGYVLYVESPASDEQLQRLGHDIESALRGAFHYDYARRLDQLPPLRVFRAEGSEADFLQRSIREGRRAGDIKLPALDRRTGWSRTFRGRFLFA